jgi:transcriptional regulator with XRE-family HTH domain
MAPGLPLVKRVSNTFCLLPDTTPIGYTRPVEKFADQQVGLRIRLARAQMGLTQRQFAERLGVSAGLVGAWESHIKTPSVKTLKRISEETGISMDAISRTGFSSVQSLTVSDPDEIQLLMSFRKLPEIGKQNCLQLLEMTANMGRVKKQKRSPAKV